jgi:hypothetical protein
MALTRREYHERVEAARKLVADTLRENAGANALQRRAAVRKALAANFPDVALHDAEPARGRNDLTTGLPYEARNWGSFAKRQYLLRNR